MSGGWSNTFQSSLTIPTGATSGARIVLDGVTGLISVYNASDQLVDTIGGAFGEIISYAVALTQDIAMREGRLLLGTASTDFTNSGKIYGDVLSGGSMVLDTGTGGTVPPLDDALSMFLRAGQTNRTTGNAASPHVVIGDDALNSAADLWITGSIIAADIPTQSRQTWQTPSYNAGWAGGDVAGTFRPMQYRFDPMNNLYLSGAFHTTSATPSTFAFVLPAAYRPTTNQRAAAISVNGGTVTAGYFQVGLNGNTGFFTLPAAANTDVYFSGIFPLGNIP